MGDLLIRKLTKSEVPDSSLLFWASDVHINIQNNPALKLSVEAAERVGVTHVVLGGDILDLHCLSEHPKDPDRILSAGSLLKEVEAGRWFLNWAATRPAYYIQGNHEGRLDRFIAKHVPALYGTEAGSLATLARIPSQIEMLPWADGTSELRLGNLSFVHGDGEFKRGTGGRFPAQRLLDMLPDQSTICGHLHRLGSARRTTRDEHGVLRTHAAFTMPHLSVEEHHHGYAGKVPNWQTGFGLVRVYWEGERPRFTVYQVEILFDRRNKPYFELWGRVYR